MPRNERRSNDVSIDFTVRDAAGKAWTLSDHLDSAAVVTFHRGDF
jgi:peroxiredoxin